MNRVQIAGGSIAGCAAALAALQEGAEVSIFERSRLPKHRVCGEFISPEIVPILDKFGLFESFLSRNPFRVRRMTICLGRREKRAALPEPAYGLSRYSFDHLLWTAAINRGARHEQGVDAHVIATGRTRSNSARGRRLFGFKAHYQGPVDDAVELYFFDGAYVGINSVEDGKTNVCGLASEDALKSCNFEPEELMSRSDPLRRRLRPVARSMDWLFTGPLEYGQRWQERQAYLAGDALSFVDPFTGSGMLCAALTGSLAGVHATRRTPVDRHVAACREIVGRPFFFSSVLRNLAHNAWAEHLAAFVPGRLLFRLTRPR